MTKARTRLGERIDTIEGAYEFFLAYAAQGLSHEVEGSKVGGQMRRELEGMKAAIADLGGLLGAVMDEEEALPFRPELQAFREVLEADAARAGAVVNLVQAQSFASSQLVDNLNASVHLRALLTDLFLLDELLTLGVDKATAPQSS